MYEYFACLYVCAHLFMTPCIVFIFHDRSWLVWQRPLLFKLWRDREPGSCSALKAGCLSNSDMMLKAFMP